MQLTTAVSLDDLILFILFLCALWIFKWVFDIVHAGIIGQMLVGVLFVSLPTKDLWPGVQGIELLGSVAVILIIFEGGMSIRLSVLRTVGMKAFLVATLGVVLPVGSGIGILVAMGYTVTEGIAGGAALASTSNVVGVALMQRQNILQSRFGTMLTAATMIDDIYSLILLSVVAYIPKSGGPKLSASKVAWNISRTILASLITMAVGVLLVIVVKVFLKGMDGHFRKEKAENHQDEAPQTEEAWPQENSLDPDRVSLGSRNSNSEASSTSSSSHTPDRPSRFVAFVSSNYNRLLMCFMLFLCFSLAISAEMAGASRLLGCFVAGMAFAEVPYATQLWTSKIGPVKPLLEALFFASIGFFLPIRSMFNRQNALYGLAYAASSAITKFATAALIRPWTHGVATGLAMITRGELGLLLAQQALSDKTLTESSFIVVCWAVILCTLFPPFFFGILIKRYKEDILDDSPRASRQTAPLQDI